MRHRTGLLSALLLCAAASDASGQPGRGVTLMAPEAASRSSVSLQAPIAAGQPARTITARAQGWDGEFGPFDDDGFPPPPPPARVPFGDESVPAPRTTETVSRPVVIDRMPEARPVSVFLPVSENFDEEAYNTGAVAGDLPVMDTWVDRGWGGGRDDRPGRSASAFPPAMENLFPGVRGDPYSGRGRFESDRCFENFISPVTNPFLAEDPRTLTEIRPLYIYQTIPEDQFLYRGGNVQFFGAQGRLALTERFSFVIHKLGGTRIAPGDNSFLGTEVNFSEIHLGPKYNFWRDEIDKTLVSGGLIFQIPIGGSGTFQDTGDLSLVPYLSVARNFWKTSWGSFNFMDTVGYSFATDSERSDFLYNSLHLDFNILDLNRFYPLMELNWFRYTKDGGARPLLGFEGADIANTGAAVDGRNYLNIAAGMRFKVTDSWELGVAAEFPLLNTRDLNDFRITGDVIWRY